MYGMEKIRGKSISRADSDTPVEVEERALYGALWEKRWWKIWTSRHVQKGLRERAEDRE